MSSDVKLVDYSKIDSRVVGAIKAIEDKPHVRFIRYLLIKRFSPRVIKQELFSLGLSAPHEPNLVRYYLTVIDPMIKKLGLSPLYADYKNKILSSEGKQSTPRGFSKDILNYRLHIGDNPDLQVAFCYLIKVLDIDILWSDEIFKFHGSLERMPTDRTGKRIIDPKTVKRLPDKIVGCPQRKIIDKLILENVPDSRIARYCKENLRIPVYEYDVHMYKKIFFNVKHREIDEKIDALEVEKESLKNFLYDLDNTAIYKDIEMGEKNLLRKQAQERMSELDENIQTLSVMFNDLTAKVAQNDLSDCESIFTDILARGYNRFVSLDQYSDRDVVDCLVKSFKIVASAHDKLEAIKMSKSAGDKHVNMNIMELQRRRLEEIDKEERERANKALEQAGLLPNEDSINPDEIGGIDELSVVIDMDDSE